MTATMVTERQILFSGPMVRALLDGSKTQTRRVVKPQPELLGERGEDCRVKIGAVSHSGPTRYMLDRLAEFGCPYGVPGDRLWVRETWGCPPADHPLVKDGRKPQQGDRIVYAANPADAWQWRGGPGCSDFVWRPSIFMPRWASRIMLAITDVRVERVQDISVADARAEGISEYGHEFRDEKWFPGDDMYRNSSSPENYARLWDSINGKDAPWASNPWVWVIAFEVAS